MNAVECAGAAAEAVRSLNHVTMRDGYEWASDVDAVVAELSLMAHRLGQALRQADRWIVRKHALGLIGHDEGRDPGVSVGMSSAALENAMLNADRLGHSLDRARAQLSHLTGPEDGRS